MTPIRKHNATETTETDILSSTQGVREQGKRHRDVSDTKELCQRQVYFKRNIHALIGYSERLKILTSSRQPWRQNPLPA